MNGQTVGGKNLIVCHFFFCLFIMPHAAVMAAVISMLTA